MHKIVILPINDITPKCLDLLKEIEGKPMPFTMNFPNYQGVVFVYTGENWELFSNAIRKGLHLLTSHASKTHSGMHTPTNLSFKRFVKIITKNYMF